MKDANLIESIDDRRLALEWEKLEIEKATAEFNRRFVNRHLAVIITAIVSLTAVAVSWIQWSGMRAQRERETYLAELQQTREWNLSLASFVSDHKEDIFEGDAEQRKRMQELILATFPPNVTSILFQRLEETANSADAKKNWQDAQIAVPYNRDVLVWTNSASKVYHCPGSQWYQNTSHGVLMRQEDARAQGYRPAYDNLCQ